MPHVNVLFYFIAQNHATFNRMHLSLSHLRRPQSVVRQQEKSLLSLNISSVSSPHPNVLILLRVVRNTQRWNLSLVKSCSSIAQPTLYLVHFPLKNRKGLQGRTSTRASAEGQVGEDRARSLSTDFQHRITGTAVADVKDSVDMCMGVYSETSPQMSTISDSHILKYICSLPY